MVIPAVPTASSMVADTGLFALAANMAVGSETPTESALMVVSIRGLGGAGRGFDVPVSTVLTSFVTLTVKVRLVSS